MVVHKFTANIYWSEWTCMLLTISKLIWYFLCYVSEFILYLNTPWLVFWLWSYFRFRYGCVGNFNATMKARLAYLRALYLTEFYVILWWQLVKVYDDEFSLNTFSLCIVILLMENNTLIFSYWIILTPIFLHPTSGH